MAVKIQFTQGVTVGVVGEAMIGSMGTEVTAKDGAPLKGDNSFYRWTWIDVPTTSAIPVGTFLAGPIAQMQFMPDVRGDYHLMVERTDASGLTTVDKRVFRVLLASGRVLPAFDTEAPALNFSGRKTGWKLDLEQWLLFLDSLSVGGSDTQMLFNNAGAVAGTSNLEVVAGEIVHQGTPQHKETESRFQGAGDAYGHARSKWKASQTTNNTPTSLLSINVPISIGDCHVTVTWEATCSAATGGGNIVRKTVFRRNGGTMAIVRDADRGDPADLTIVVSMAGNVTDNENVALLGTGLASANVNWVVSSHIQIAVEAA